MEQLKVGTHNYDRQVAAPVHLTPTFPLNAREIRNLRETVIWQSPKFLAWRLLGLVGTHFAVLSHFTQTWSSLEVEMSEAIREYAIKQSNARQDEAIRSLIGVLRRCDSRQYAYLLGRFLSLKQRTEAGLSNNAEMALRREDVEILVDSIMQEVCHELVRLTALQSTLIDSLTDSSPTKTEKLHDEIAKAHDRIRRAYDTLRETERQTNERETRRYETNKLEPTEEKELERLIGMLREENEVSKAVHNRLRAEFSDLNDRAI